MVEQDDVTALLRHVAKITQITDPYALLLGDVAANEALDADDTTKLLRYVARIISSLD